MTVDNTVMWVIQLNTADWVCSKTQILLVTLKIRNQLQGDFCLFGSRTFVLVSWMCKKQTSVSHRSTESEIISLDAGLRMGGIPALDLWDLVDRSVTFVKEHRQAVRDQCRKEKVDDQVSEKSSTQ